MYNGQGVYCGLRTASEVFLTFLLPKYTNILVCSFYLHLFSEEPEVFLSKYSQTGILHAAHFRRVVNFFTSTQLMHLCCWVHDVTFMR